MIYVPESVLALLQVTVCYAHTTAMARSVWRRALQEHMLIAITLVVHVILNAKDLASGLFQRNAVHRATKR